MLPRPCHSASTSLWGRPGAQGGAGEPHSAGGVLSPRNQFTHVPNMVAQGRFLSRRNTGVSSTFPRGAYGLGSTMPGLQEQSRESPGISPLQGQPAAGAALLTSALCWVWPSQASLTEHLLVGELGGGQKNYLLR